MRAKQFHETLAAEGINRAVSDAIIDYVDGQKSDLVTNQTLALEMTKLRGELKTEMADLRGDIRTEMADLRGELKGEMADLRGENKTDMAVLHTDFVTLRADMTQLVLGSSGILGLLMIALRFLPS